MAVESLNRMIGGVHFPFPLETVFPAGAETLKTKHKDISWARVEQDR